jgi:hypothetical protein
MNAPDYREFFERYVDVFNRVLDGDAPPEQVRASYAEHFVSASAGGVVQGGANDERYAQVLRDGAEFYRLIGTQRMHLRGVEAMPIDDQHDLVRVRMKSDYERRDGHRFSLEFAVAYLLQRREAGPRIFAFVAGDEMALYREHGLVDEQGRPR